MRSAQLFGAYGDVFSRPPRQGREARPRHRALDDTEGPAGCRAGLGVKQRAAYSYTHQASHGAFGADATAAAKQ
jgi:hypothetical protein